MQELKTEIIITAAPSAVWEVLTNFKEFSNWNSFMPSIDGELNPGKSLTVKITPPGNKPMEFKPKLLTVNPSKELRWRGVLGAPWIFCGEHYFILEPRNHKETKFIHGEIFGGLLLPLIWKKIQKSTEQGFLNMNLDLKKKVESLS